jgi:Uma2 family endonuclease
MANPATSGYTAEDLDWLRDALGAAHLELDPWGSPIVSPADDEHEGIAVALARQAIEQLSHVVSTNGYPWVVPGGTGYLMVPDLLVLRSGWQRAAELHFDPPPLLVVEIASRSTRGVDRSRKLADYRLGGAEQYLLVDRPADFELHHFARGEVVNATGEIDLVVGGQPVRFSLSPG